MACPTCDHTMQSVGTRVVDDDRSTVFWCPRCGSLKTEVDMAMPKLVERCRLFAEKFSDPDWADCDAKESLWRSLGIAESINRPGR